MHSFPYCTQVCILDKWKCTFERWGSDLQFVGSEAAQNFEDEMKLVTVANPENVFWKEIHFYSNA